MACAQHKRSRRLSRKTNPRRLPSGLCEKFGSALAGLALLTSGALAQDKPSELKIGITTFLSGPASVFGVPAKQLPK